MPDAVVVDLAQYRRKRKRADMHKAKRAMPPVRRFSPSRDTEKPGWYRDRNGVKRFRPYTLAHLSGRRPKTHPPLRLSCFGKVLIEPDQFWVEIGTSALWIIAALHERGDGFYTVHLRPYRCRQGLPRVVSERTLRTCFEVWEKARKSEQSRCEC